MTTAITLLLAHLLGDFPLQTNKVFKLKTQGNFGLAIHVAIHLAVTALLIHHPFHYWPVLLLLGLAHFTTDWVKLHFPGKNQAASFIWDQLVHYITILLIALWVPDLPAILPTWIMIPAIALTFIPAILIFFWVWASQIQQTSSENETLCITWATVCLLPISQRLGQIIVLIIALTGSIILI
jgi:hypothetical protein